MCFVIFRFGGFFMKIKRNIGILYSMSSLQGMFTGLLVFMEICQKPGCCVLLPFMQDGWKINTALQVDGLTEWHKNWEKKIVFYSFLPALLFVVCSWLSQMVCYFLWFVFYCFIYAMHCCSLYSQRFKTEGLYQNKKLPYWV